MLASVPPGTVERMTIKSLSCRRLVVALLAATLLLAAAPAALADDDDDAVAGELVLRLAPGQSIEQLNARYGTRTREVLNGGGDIYLVEADDQAAENLESDPGVLYTEPNSIGSSPEGSRYSGGWGSTGPKLRPSDAAAYREQPAGRRIGLAAAHARSTGLAVVVAVLDTGITGAHEVFQGRIAPGGYDVIEDDGDPQDTGNGLDDDLDGAIDEGVGHGTHVAGVVLLAAPAATVLPVRVLDSDARGTVWAAAEGLRHAVEAGASVVNLSLGMAHPSELLEDVIEEAEEADVVVVAAAGNLASTTPSYPAAEEDVLAVAATDAADARATFSSYGLWIDVAAPGSDVISAVPSGYASWSGTSMAAPLVAGQAALLLARDPALSAEDVVETIVGTARRLSSGLGLGGGRVDVGRSLTGTPTPP